jgi:hypothetical protein
MDVAPHWNGRGSGSKPAGEPTVKPVIGLPFQQLESLDEPWIPFSEAKIKYERDKADPQKEKTFNIKHPDYQFRGYRLDKNRFPAFQYSYRDLEVTDTFSPKKLGDKDALVRKLSIKGDAGENLYFRISNLSPGEPGAEEPGWITIGSMSVKIEGAEPAYRQSGGNKEVLAPIKGDTDLTITYRWSEPREPVVESSL